jgi:anion-transporting  ArsA/GET3 family ATPase
VPDRGCAMWNGWLPVDPLQLLTSSQVLIVAGKGGVGKTTVSAALGVAAASLGLRALVIAVESDQQLTGPLGIDHVPYQPVPVAHPGPGTLAVCGLGPREALVDYLGSHGLRRLSNRLASSGALDVVATAAPGIDDILVLGKVKQLANGGEADLVIVDAPASGHAITFLGSAHGLLDAVKVGPIQTQARDVVELLTDPARAQVVLVTLPEETPVNELVETAYALEEDIGVALGPVVVNGVYPGVPGLARELQTLDARGATGEAVEVLQAAARFRLARAAMQQTQRDRMAAELPLPIIELPFVFDARVGRDGVDALAAELLAQIAALPSTGDPT